MRSREMRWYRQVTRELVRDELADLVALAHEEVIDPAHDGDPRMRHRRLELGARSELIALGRDDERTSRDVRKGSRRESSQSAKRPLMQADVVAAPVPVALTRRASLNAVQSLLDYAARLAVGLAVTPLLGIRAAVEVELEAAAAVEQALGLSPAAS